MSFLPSIVHTFDFYSRFADPDLLGSGNFYGSGSKLYSRISDTQPTLIIVEPARNENNLIFTFLGLKKSKIFFYFIRTGKAIQHCLISVLNI